MKLCKHCGHDPRPTKTINTFGRTLMYCGKCELFLNATGEQRAYKHRFRSTVPSLREVQREMEEIIHAVEKDNRIEREYPEEPFKTYDMKSPTTRSFLITETTYADGTTETRQRGDISDMEVMHYLKKKERKLKQYPER